jgi:hypothetical protein
VLLNKKYPIVLSILVWFEVLSHLVEERKLIDLFIEEGKDKPNTVGIV